MDQIYTSIGPILIAINPFKTINSLYNTETMQEYRRRVESLSASAEENLPPHVFKVAAVAYRLIDLISKIIVATHAKKKKV